MNSNRLRVAVIAALLGVAGATSAQAASGNHSTTAGSATAHVIAPLVLRHVRGHELNFGSFSVGTGGTVMVNSNGLGSVSNDVRFAPGSVTAADEFEVTGDHDRNFSIVTHSGTVRDGSKIIHFTTTPSSDQGRLNTLGRATFTVGGTLALTGSETAGTYRGKYHATVTYD